MYNAYFGFREAPFSIAPDPRYLYMTEQHREALAHLVYGLNHDGGCILLTGEVGTGKTTICRCLLEQIPDKVNVALILNPRIDALELLETLCDELGIDVAENSRSIKTCTDRIHRYLIEHNARNERTVLIIDEAQNLSPGVLEQLRLLTNLETNQRKLLQIIILGQPELLDMLAQPALRQLAQRITARYHLRPLSADEMKAYISHRLAVAGQSVQLFPDPVIRKLYKLSQGIPRLVNILCDRALLGCYVENRMQVEPAILKKAANEVFGELGEQTATGGTTRRTHRWLPVALVALAAILAIVLYRALAPSSSTPASAASAPAARLSKPSEHEKSAQAGNKIQTQLDGETPAREVATPAKANNLTNDTFDARPAPTTPHTGDNDAAMRDFLRHATDTEQTAFARLFKSWQVEYRPGQSACEQASAHGLRCLRKQGNLTRLLAYNRPAILRLFDREGGSHSVTLEAYANKRLQLNNGVQNLVVDADTLNRFWLGRFSLLWRPPVSYRRPLRPGDSGDLVDWLQQRLLQIEADDDLKQAVAAANRVYNESLAQRVKRFQKRQGLNADGVVGPVTLIHLDDASGGASPKLHATLD